MHITPNSRVVRLTVLCVEAAISQRKAYDKWIVDNGKDIGESLAAYGSATDACLKATKGIDGC